MVRKIVGHPVRIKVARLLREERLRQQLSLNQLAKMAGLSQQMVSYVEREMRCPTLETLLVLCDALEIELWRLLKAASK